MYPLFSYLSPVLAGTSCACRAGEKSHLHVYMRDLFLQKFYGVQKTKICLVTLARHICRRQLACEPQQEPVNLKQEVWPISQFAVRNRTKNDQFSRSTFYIQQHADCCFCCTSVQGKTVLKVHGNLNKEASGSMKLN